MDFSPAFSDVHSHQVRDSLIFFVIKSFYLFIQNDIHPSPMSLPPSAAPRSVAPKEEAYPVNTDATTHHHHHHPSIASKITTMGPPPSVLSYHPNSVAPSTPYTPRPVDVSHLQPSLQ
jgi:hypothetical protein